MKFKSPRQVRAFQATFITVNMLILFSKPIWDFYLRPAVMSYRNWQGKNLRNVNLMAEETIPSPRQRLSVIHSVGDSK